MFFRKCVFLFCLDPMCRYCVRYEGAVLYCLLQPHEVQMGREKRDCPISRQCSPIDIIAPQWGTPAAASSRSTSSDSIIKFAKSSELLNALRHGQAK